MLPSSSQSVLPALLLSISVGAICYLLGRKHGQSSEKCKLRGESGGNIDDVVPAKFRHGDNNWRQHAIEERLGVFRIPPRNTTAPDSDRSQDWEELKIRVHGGMHVAAKRWRTGSDKAGPPKHRILALHGWLDNAASFDLMMPLMPDGCCIVAMDLMGHGHSDHRPGFYHFVDHVADVIAVARALGWDGEESSSSSNSTSSSGFTLLGHSLGGNVAVCVAGALAENRCVRSLVLIEGFGPEAGPCDAAPRKLLRSVLKGGKHRPPTVHATAEAAARRRAQGFMPIPVSAGRVLVQRGLRPAPNSSSSSSSSSNNSSSISNNSSNNNSSSSNSGNDSNSSSSSNGFIWRSDPGLLEPSRLYMSEEKVRAFLSGVECATLLLLARDGLFQPDALRADRLGRRDNFKRLEEVWLPQGGHHVHMTEPQATMEAVCDFLAREGGH